MVLDMARTPQDQPVDQLMASLLALDRLAVKRTLRQAAESASAPTVVIDSLVVPVLEEIGRGWEAGDISLAEVYMAGRIIEDAIDEVLAEGEGVASGLPQPTIAICVLEDSHGLGKRIVSSCVRAAGFDVIDLGVRCSVEDVVTQVRERDIEILLVSTLMLRAALAVATLTQRLADEGMGHVRVVVGGAPFRYDSQLWREVGAHGWGVSASDAIAVVAGMAGRR